MSGTITCSMCGTRFDPTGRNTCQGCPVQTGCQLVCCPTCGFETVDPAKSTLSRLAARLFFGKSNHQATGTSALDSKQRKGESS